MDVQDGTGQTPLHAALAEGHAHVAILLLHSGADIDIQNAVFTYTFLAPPISHTG